MTGERIVFLDAGTIGPGVTLRRPAFEHDWRAYDRTAPHEVAARLEGTTIAVTNKAPIGADALEKLPDLKLVAVAATGYDVVDVDACAKRGIAVANIRGYAVNTVPEHTFALILALRRNVVEYRGEVLDGAWVEADQFCFFNRPIHDLAGSVLGVVGAGAIGRAVGRIGAAFGMEVVFHDRFVDEAPDGARLVELEELRERADVVTCHCPLTDETRNLIDGAFLGGMKPTAIVVNTARGGIVDEAALAEAIRAGAIAGAGIDVTAVEPPPMDTPIMEIAALPNVIVTPHVAWASVGGMQDLCDQLTANIEAFVGGHPQNLVA